MALVKVNQFFMNNADIPEKKRVGARGSGFTGFL